MTNLKLQFQRLQFCWNIKDKQGRGIGAERGHVSHILTQRNPLYGLAKRGEGMITMLQNLTLKFKHTYYGKSSILWRQSRLANICCGVIPARYKITLRNQKEVAKWVFWPWTWVILTTILPPPRLFNATILGSISPCLTTTWSSTLEAQRRALRDREKFEFSSESCGGKGGRQHYWANKKQKIGVICKYNIYIKTECMCKHHILQFIDVFYWRMDMYIYLVCGCPTALLIILRSFASNPRGYI